MSYVNGDWINVLSLGLVDEILDAGGSTPPITTGPIALAFYTVTTTADRTETETELYSAATGLLQLERRERNEQEKYGQPVERYRFFPDVPLAAVVYGTKATSGSYSFVVDGVETFEDHQEITMVRVS